MAIRDILVSVDATAAGEVRLKLATELAAKHAASLTAAYVVTNGGGASTLGFGPPSNGESIGSAGLGAPIAPTAGPATAAERAEQAEIRFRSELQMRGMDGDWRLVEDGAAAEFIDLVKACDLAVLGQQSSDAKGDGAAAKLRPDDIVVEVGRPVLIVPYAGSFETVGRRVLIGWDSTREATRALNDALPLIERAETVTVLYVGAQESELERARPMIDRIVRHLERHQIKAQPEESLKGDMAVSDLLLSRAADLDADLIITGGYHHSQLREALLGGVSRELLRHMTVPVLMSH